MENLKSPTLKTVVEMVFGMTVEKVQGFSEDLNCNSGAETHLALDG